ncbi:MAG TPA: BTAD domain-containing putative transcriptional regulator, partial [Longimicrobiaceae bacterium]|nr:BTAD domain-containing putative transcriptional regulator [Longimicrobiaceae bacterium]
MLHVTLFGRFGASLDTGAVRVREGSKAEELLVYLLLHRQRPHTRERVACLLWEECSEERSRAYLRKALWELQAALHPPGCGGSPLLRVDATWVQVDPDAELWLDVEAFECAYERTRGTPGREIDDDAAHRLADAVSLYAGGLLQDHYQEWCLVERERLRHLYLVMLDKLVEHSEARREYEMAVLYGLEILRHDAAREHTHRQLMRLHHLRGDRTGALRQFRACVEVLNADLLVEPHGLFHRLHPQLRVQH